MLTPVQLAALKADILADPAFALVPNSPDGAFEIAAAYSLTAVPNFWVWRTAVTKDELVNAPSIDGTVFAWTGTGFITRSVGERDAWRELFDAGGVVNPSLPQVRQAFLDIFSGGTAPAPANRTHLATVARRKARRGEKLFAVGVGTTASPATMAGEGDLSYQDVQTARDLP